MKLLLLLLIYTTVIVTPKTEGNDLRLAELNFNKRNIFINILINKLFAYLRQVIIHGSTIVGIPILDPFVMEEFSLVIPAGLFNLGLRFKNISVRGFGGFILNKNILHLSNLTFEIEVSLPRIILRAETVYMSETDNDFMSAIPIYRKDRTELEMDNFRLQTNLQLKQSDDERSILIEKIERTFIDIPSIKINSGGIVDGDDFDIFADLEEGLVEYVKSCEGAILKFISNAILTFGNPILNRLDTWRYIGVLL